MNFNEKLYIAGCIVGYHACMLGLMLGLEDSLFWVFPACFFIFAALSFIDVKVKK